MTSNELYGQLNARFDIRAAFLRNHGYIYERIEAYDISVFIKRDVMYRKPHVIQTGTISHACEQVWMDVENAVMDRCR